MAALSIFYLSRIIGKKAFDANGISVGVVVDLLIDTGVQNSSLATGRPRVIGIRLKKGRQRKIYSFDQFKVQKIQGRMSITCSSLKDLSEEMINDSLLLAEIILDKQIVDLNGRKLVRVNDVRLVTVSEGTFAIAVDIGIEGLLRRIGIAKPVKHLLNLFDVSIPAKFILWDDVQAIDFSNLNIKLSKSYSKLNTLHPSDLAEIIEELGQQSRTQVFSALDEEKAADVFEELETHAQLHIIDSMPVDKVADMFEKMPADEVADIIDELEDEKAEILLKEMEAESSQEVRELLEYDDNTVGSIMTTDYLAFSPDKTVEEVINELRNRKPEDAELYNIFVTDQNEELLATFTLRDLVVSEPQVTVRQIMKEEPISLFDTQKVNDIAEIISKYNLLAVPVVNEDFQLQGMVVVDDVVEDLVGERKTKKR
jgi:CBS domain-containing protein/sporulation protein YlmC with PRC-barrel domain